MQGSFPEGLLYDLLWGNTRGIANREKKGNLRVKICSEFVFSFVFYVSIRGYVCTYIIFLSNQQSHYHMVLGEKTL